MRFLIVDVFAETPLAGNQLAVVFANPDLETAQMQRIAREFNFSETSFVLRQQDDGKPWPVRIFTPGRELPFAGHPTLGTAWAIRSELSVRGATVVLDEKVGEIPVRGGGEPGALLWMRQRQPSFGKTLARRETAELLCLGEDRLHAVLEPQEVSTGIEFAIVPLKDLAAVREARLDRERFAALASKPVFLFAPETYDDENDFNARMLEDGFGISEDPATGSAAGCLAAYLVKHRARGERITARVEQGYEIERRSLLHIGAQQEKDGIAVEVGGRVCPIARGELL